MLDSSVLYPPAALLFTLILVGSGRNPLLPYPPVPKGYPIPWKCTGFRRLSFWEIFLIVGQ